MRLKEADKLRQDLNDLTMVRKNLAEMREKLQIGKRLTRCYLRLMLTREIIRIDERIGEKQQELLNAEVRIRLGAHSKETRNETV